MTAHVHAFDDVKLPSDIGKEIAGHDQRFVYLTLAGVGAVTVDLELRGWRRGWSQSGMLDGGQTGSSRVLRGRSVMDFRGRGWAQKLADAAIADLRGPDKKAGA